jgi:DNA-directed RNA polymerase specialized sigma24 family protein
MTPAELFALASREDRAIARAITRVGIADADTDDVRQLALIDAWRLIAGGRLVIADGQDTRIALRRWIYSVARIAALRFRQAYRPIGDDLPDDIPSDDDLEARLASREQLRILFYRMNRYERAAFEGLAAGETFQETADRTGIHIGTIASRVRYGRVALKKRLARDR